VGWRISVIAGGVIALGSCLLLVLLVPEDPVVGAISVRFSELKGIILNKWLLIVSAGLVVSQVAFGINTYFMVYYLEESLRTGVVVAGAVGGVSLVISVIMAPFVGRAFDRSPSPKRMFIVFCLAAAGGLAITAVNSVYAAIISALIVGVSTAGAYVFGIGIGRAIGGARKEYAALGISWINGLALFGGVVMPLVFAEIAAGFGYPLAWALSGVLLVGVTIPLLALRGEAGT